MASTAHTAIVAVGGGGVVVVVVVAIGMIDAHVHELLLLLLRMLGRSVFGVAAGGRVQSELGYVRVDHPPRALARALILHSDEAIVQRQVVPYRVL